MADALPDMYRYVQSHVVGAIGAQGLKPGASVPFDGYSCEWWRNRASFEAGMETDVWRRIVDDGPEVFDPASLEGMSAALEERVRNPGCPSRRPPATG